jgi:hypothetical protein
LNHITLIQRDAQRVVAGLHALAAARIATCEPWDDIRGRRRAIGGLGRNLPLALGFERDRLPFDP